MRFNTFVAVCLTTLVLAIPLIAGEQPRSAQQDTTAQQETGSNPWTERRIIGVVLSTVIPGSGQAYLGHTEKGAAFTLGTLASALIAGLSENNVVGRNERLEELRVQYQSATSYVGADTIWQKMVSTKGILDKDVKRRDLFVKIAIGLWVANIVDMAFFTDDRGEKPFGLLDTRRTTLALVPDPKNGINAQLTVKF